MEIEKKGFAEMFKRKFVKWFRLFRVYLEVTNETKQKKKKQIMSDEEVMFLSFVFFGLFGCYFSLETFKSKFMLKYFVKHAVN